MHLAPRGDAHSMGDSDRAATFGYVARELGRRGLAFLCVRESLGAGRIGPDLKAAFGGTYIANEKFTRETAEQVLARRRGRRRGLRQALHREPGPAPPFRGRRPAQRAEPRDVLRIRARRVTSTIPFLDRAVRTA